MKTPTTAAEALAAIPTYKTFLDTEDAKLVEAIHHVEHALNEMKPGVAAVFTYAVQGNPRRLEFCAANRRWIIIWISEQDDLEVPLLSASRSARAEVFAPLADGHTPVENLVIEVARSLCAEGTARSAATQAAQRLVSVLTAAGFPPP